MTIPHRNYVNFAKAWSIFGSFRSFLLFLQIAVQDLIFIFLQFHFFFVVLVVFYVV